MTATASPHAAGHSADHSAGHSAATGHSAAVASDTARPVTFARVVGSEWIKFRSLRVNWILLVSTVVLVVGFGAIAAGVATGSVTSPDGQDGPGLGGDDPLSNVFAGANFAVLLLGVFGCLAGAREYGSRMIATTLTAVPRRWPVLAAKALVLVLVTLPSMLVSVFAAFAVGMSILSAGDAATVSLGDDGVLLSVAGMAGYLTVVTLLGLALGVLLRSVASSIGILVAGVLILPGIAGALLPDSWDSVLQYLPTNAAAAFTAVSGTSDQVLGSTAGIVTLLAWGVVALAAAGAGLMRRDV